MGSKKLSPRNATTNKAICSLESDNSSMRDGWIMIEEKHVVMHNQRKGNASTGKVRFTKKQFNALIDWYNKDQNTNP